MPKVTPVPVLDRKDLPGLVRALETSPNTHVKQNAWRLVRENHGEAGARALAALKRPEMGSQAELRYAAARKAETPAQRQQVLADFAAAQDDWTRSALIAGAGEHATDVPREAAEEAGAEGTGKDRAFVHAREASGV